MTDIVTGKDRTQDLVLADALVGKRLWAARWLRGSGKASDWTLLDAPQEKRVQYASILQGGTILLHFKDCAAPLDIYGKYLYTARDAAEKYIDTQRARNAEA